MNKRPRDFLPIIVCIGVIVGLCLYFGISKQLSQSKVQLIRQHLFIELSVEQAVNDLGTSLRRLLNDGYSEQKYGYALAEATHVELWFSLFCQVDRNSDASRYNAGDLNNVSDYFSVIRYLLLNGDKTGLLLEIQEKLYGKDFYDTSSQHLTIDKLIEICNEQDEIYNMVKEYQKEIPVRIIYPIL